MMDAVQSIETRSNSIHSVWADDRESAFHFLWLRDNCSCKKCGSHTSGSRFQSFLAIPDDISPASVSFDPAGVTIIWQKNEHESRFEYRWLRENSASTKRTFRKTLWNSELSSYPQVDYRLALEDDAELYKLFSGVFEYGFIIVKNVGLDADETVRLAKRIGYTRETHFGQGGDLMLRIN